MGSWLFSDKLTVLLKIGTSVFRKPPWSLSFASIKAFIQLVHFFYQKLQISVYPANSQNYPLFRLLKG